MKEMKFQEKYPILQKSFSKKDLSKNLDEICIFFQKKIENSPTTAFISIFDNFAHTKSINGEINTQIIGAKNVIFCFGKAIPNEKVLALRPRSIAVAEFRDRFEISFLCPPNENMQKAMENWVENLD